MPYSKTELIVSLYSKSRVALSGNLTLCSTANFPLAFSNVECICLSQSNVEESQSPRCRCWCTLVMKLSSSMRGGELKRYLFRENIKSLLLPALNKTFHLLAHKPIFLRSLLRTSAVIAESSPEANRQVSSANNRHSDSKSSIIS